MGRRGESRNEGREEKAGRRVNRTDGNKELR